MRARRLGMRARMMFIAASVGLPFLVFLLSNAAQQASLDRHHGEQQMRLLSVIAVARLDDNIADIRRLLDTLADTLSVDRAAAGANDVLLRGMQPRFPDNVSGVSIWAVDGSRIGSSDAAGSVLASDAVGLESGPHPDPAPPSAAGRGFFREALLSPTMIIEAPIRNAPDRPWIANFAVPVLRQGHVVAVLNATAALATMQGVASLGVDLPDGAVISTVDLQGRIITRSLDADGRIGRQAFDDPTEPPRRFAQGRGSFVAAGADGIDRVNGFARSLAAPWLVQVDIPLDAVRAPAIGQIRRTLTLGCAMLVFGFAMAAVLAERIAWPLRQLSADATILGEGRLEHRSQVRSSGEIGALALNLNRMAQALQDHTSAIRRSEERLTLALENSGQSTLDWDLVADRGHFGPKGSPMFGGADAATDMSSEEMLACVHPDDLAPMRRRLDDALSGASPAYDAEYRIRGQGGSWMWVRTLGRVVQRDGDGRALRLVGVQSDIGERKKTEEALRHRAEFDPLTGLPNRALFDERVGLALQRSAKTRRPPALLFLDIDHFKEINDGFGHHAGDEVLKVVAQRLLDGVRTSDTVARLAGDEFTVILEGLNSEDDAESVARELVRSIRAPLRLDGRLIDVSASIGVALATADELDGAAWLRRADRALYEAKRKGRDCYVLFGADDTQPATI